MGGFSYLGRTEGDSEGLVPRLDDAGGEGLEEVGEGDGEEVCLFV